MFIKNLKGISVFTLLLLLNSCGNQPSQTQPINLQQLASQATLQIVDDKDTSKLDDYYYLNIVDQETEEEKTEKQVELKVNTLKKINEAIDESTGTKNTYENSDVEFFFRGEEAFPELEKMLLSAKESIFFEVFQFHNDESGNKFADIMIKKAKEGVDVHFIYDFAGNIIEDQAHIRRMKKNGVKVAPFNRKILTKNGNKIALNITHRKLFIVDGTRAMTGGMNIGDDYAYKWHDSMTSFSGEAVKDSLNEFIYDWKKSGQKVTLAMGKAILSKADAIDDSKKYPIRVTVTSPKEEGKKTDIKKMMMSAIDHATDNVRIAMPFFADDEFVDHLIKANERGVEVIAYIPGNHKSQIINDFNQTTVNQFIQAGVKTYLGGLKDDIYSHSKIMTVDNIWSTVGSCNADYRAFQENQELNIAISDEEFTAKINTRFFPTLEKGAELAKYKKTNVAKKSYYAFLEKIDNLY